MPKRKTVSSPRKRSTLEDREKRHTEALEKIKLQRQLQDLRKKLYGK